MRIEAIIQELRRLVNGEETDSLELAEILYHHRCYALLTEMQLECEWKQKAQRSLMLHQLSLRRRYLSCKPVWETLSAERIPFAVVKGAVLSQTAYGSVNKRVSGDVDMLIRREDADTVKRIFREQGFIQGQLQDGRVVPFTRAEQLFYASASHQLAPFMREESDLLCPYINVDVNFDIFWGESEKHADMSFVLSEMEQTTICGVKVQKLPAEMEFIAMCLHHYKDMNSLYLLYNGNLKLSLFCDLLFYIRYNDLCTSKLLKLAQELSVAPYLYYCLHYTNLLFDDPKVQTLRDAMETPAGHELLSCYGLTEEERKEWTIPFEERLFGSGMRAYLEAGFTESDWSKIRKNQQYL